MKRSQVPSLVLAAFSAILILNYSCVDHDFGAPFTVDCVGLEEISYAADVKPIIKENCLHSGCHGDNPDLPDWGVLAELQDKKLSIQNRITLPLTDGSKMPKEGSITDQERQTIYCWIEQGAKDN